MWTLDRFARERAAAAVRALMFSNDIFDSSDSILYNYNYCYWKQQFGDYDGWGHHDWHNGNVNSFTSTSPNYVGTRTSTSRRSSFVSGGGSRSTTICRSLLRAAVRPHHLVSSTNTNDSNNSNSNYKSGFQNQSLRSILRTDVCHIELETYAACGIGVGWDCGGRSHWDNK